MKNREKMNIFFVIIIIILTATNQSEKTNKEKQDNQKNDNNSDSPLKKIIYYILLIITTLLFIAFLITVVSRLYIRFSNFFSNREQADNVVTTSGNRRTNNTNNNDNEIKVENEIRTKSYLITTIFSLLELDNEGKTTCNFIINNCLTGILYDSNKDNFDQNCSICQESFKKSEYSFKTACKHIFHQNCISEYLISEIKTCWEKKLSMDEFDIYCPNCKASLLVKKTSQKKLSMRDNLYIRESLESMQSDKNINIYDRVTVVNMKSRIKRRNDALNSNVLNDTI